MGRVRAAIIAISSPSPGGAPPPLPYIHALIHTHHEHHHHVPSFIPTQLPLLVHLSQSFFRCAVSASVASFTVGWAHSGLVAFCDKVIF